MCCTRKQVHGWEVCWEYQIGFMCMHYIINNGFSLSPLSWASSLFMSSTTPKLSFADPLLISVVVLRLTSYVATTTTLVASEYAVQYWPTVWSPSGRKRKKLRASFGSICDFFFPTFWGAFLWPFNWDELPQYFGEMPHKRILKNSSQNWCGCVSVWLLQSRRVLDVIDHTL